MTKAVREMILFMSLEEFTGGDFSEGLIWAGKMFQAEKMEGTGKEEPPTGMGGGRSPPIGQKELSPVFFQRA